MRGVQRNVLLRLQVSLSKCALRLLWFISFSLSTLLTLLIHQLNSLLLYYCRKLRQLQVIDYGKQNDPLVPIVHKLLAHDKKLVYVSTPTLCDDIYLSLSVFVMYVTLT